MAESTPKEQPPKSSGETPAAPPPAQAAPTPVAEEETAVVPVEVKSLKDGIQITIEGDFVTLILSQYLAEHIGQFRTCDKVVCRFKHGTAPDITGIRG